MQRSRADDIETFYALINQLIAKNPTRQLGSASGRDGWPDRGVYFFFEPGELRNDGTLRVVRIGTHALINGSSSTLWKRLSQHRGTISPKGGNHRGSIFRDLVGAALFAKDGRTIKTWGDRKIRAAEAVASERPHEKAVSDQIGGMHVAWLDIPDTPGPDSLRAVIERNAIALLSNYDRAPIDPASPTWLGLGSDRERVRKSGLWNNNHVTETYDPAFLNVLQNLIEERPRSATSAPSTYVMQCAKSKRDGGLFRTKEGTALTFVADPTNAPNMPGLISVHPDWHDEDGVSWRRRLIDYNKTFASTGQNPFGLHSAASLYRNPNYSAFAQSMPAERFFILSACWGLVRSDFLLPNYDVTFRRSQGVPAHVIRSERDDWHDYNMLDLMETKPLIFIGGKAYLKAFARLAGNYQGPKVAYYNLVDTPHFDQIDMRRFETKSKTNWHYELARKLLADGSPSTEAIPVVQTTPERSTLRIISTTQKPYGKYQTLHDHFLNLPVAQNTATLTYVEFEQIIGARLPQSSRDHAPTWWANGGHPQSNAWLDAGFRKTQHQLGSSDNSSWVRFDRTSWL